MAYKTYDIHTVYWMLVKAGHEDDEAVHLARLVMALGALNRLNGLTTVNNESFEIVGHRNALDHEVIVHLDNTAPGAKVILTGVTAGEAEHYYTLLANFNKGMFASVVDARVSFKVVKTAEEVSQDDSSQYVLADYAARRVASIALNHGFLQSDLNQNVQQLTFMSVIPSCMKLILSLPESWSVRFETFDANCYSSRLF